MLINNAGGLPQGDTACPVLVTHPRRGIPRVIDTPDELAEAAEALAKGRTPIALDVERAQGYRYNQNPYLIQIRREDVGTFLVDPIALPDLSSLIPGTSDTWLLHDGTQDLPNLRFVGLQPRELFDTMWASRLLGLRSFGLQASCEQFLGLSLAKDHQANDWSVRPLYSDWLRYAALDVELLTELYRRQATRLHDLGRWEWAQQDFAAELRAHPVPPHPEPWRKNTGAGRLRYPRQLAVFRALWELRERLAEKEDVDPRKLVSKNDLVEAARIVPRNRRTLLTLGGFRSPRARQYTDQWLRAIYEAFFMPPEQYPSRQGALPPGELPAASSWKMVNPEGMARLKAVRRVVAEVAAELDLADEVVVQPRAQRHVAWNALEGRRAALAQVEERMLTGGARPWQIELAAARLADALKR